jgi:leader peptidase (prepilin peptidase)/N-methyltransferase
MILLFALFGLIVGAFLNLCADQLPRWRRLRRKPFCPYCDHSRPPWAWLSILAYVRFKPACQQCGAPISWRHPLTEVATAALYAFLWHRYAVPGEWVLLLLYTVYSTIFVLVIVIDLEHRLILNVVMYPAWGLAILGSLIHPTRMFPVLALIGGAVGFGLLYLIYLAGKLFVRILSSRRGKPINAVAFGYGDVRLGLFIGLVVGFPDVLPAIFLALLLGGLAGILYWFVRAVILRDYSAFTAIPYGPYLATGAMLVMFFGSGIIML